MRLPGIANQLVIFVISLCFLVSSCHREPNYDQKPSREKEEAQVEADDPHLAPFLKSEYFINRLSSKLRNGALVTEEESQRLRAMSVPEMVDFLVADPRFINTIFDFTVYFLGFKNPNSQFPSSKSSPYVGHLGYMSSAISAAQQVRAGGDYFKLFDFYQPTYAFPMATGIFKFGEFEEDFTKEREKGLVDLAEYLGGIRDLVKVGEGAIKLPEYCKEITGGYLNRIANRLRNIDSGQISSVFFKMYDTYQERSRVHCTKPEDVSIPDDLRAAALEMVAGAESIRDHFLSVVAEPYLIRGPLDFRTFDLSKFGETAQSMQTRTNAWFWTTLPNSSTNYNRKRASYILKRFMCDDLTPIAVDLPQIHSDKSRHASDPGCLACHYKLDPIAGYFRNYGGRGFDYSETEGISFDDNAEILREQYTAAWKDPQNPEKLLVGIVRSTTDASNNLMAREDESDPAALFRVLRDLPEVRQCIVKTAIKYLVDERVSVDHGYLRYLTEEFNRKAKENSSKALTQLFANIATSNAFAQENLQEGQCYDYAPGVSPASRPPCLIADILEQNCVRCHSGPGAHGGLNLQEWNNGFKHKNLTRQESFVRIAASLNTMDAAKRMPLDTYMPPADREVLFRFFTKE